MPDVNGFAPRLVALDIDGTLFANEPSTGLVEETISPAVVAAVRRAYAAGAHVVMATGRSTFGVSHVWDQLGLPLNGAKVLSVASNGSVVFSYPPVEVRSTVTFDASAIVRMLMAEVPNAAVAVEEVGVGYRLNRPFPDGEITGEMVLQTVEELVAKPVTRVIIRDPHSSEEEFVELAEKLGLCRHQLLHRLDRVARHRARGHLQGVRAGRRRRRARRRPGRRAGDRRRPQRHRDAALGRPRRGHGPVAARGAGGRRRRHRDGGERRRRPRAVPLVPPTSVR